MDTIKMFNCTVMHPRLFPGPIIDLGNPLRVELLVEVSAEELIIHASAPRARGKIMGTESLANIGRVAREHMNAGAQRLEILRRSLPRMALAGGITLAWTLFFRAYPMGLSVMMALAIAAFIGPFYFLLSGGLGQKQDVVRFHFFPTGDDRTFYLEVPPAGEPELHEALRVAGLRFEHGEEDQRT